MYLESIIPRMVPNRLLLPRMAAILPVPTEVRDMLKAAAAKGQNSDAWDNPLDPSPEASSGSKEIPTESRPLIIPHSTFLLSALGTIAKLNNFIRKPQLIEYLYRSGRESHPRPSRVAALAEYFNTSLYK